MAVFVLFIIYIEHRQSGLSGAAIWLLSIWLLYSSSKGLGAFISINTTIEAGSRPDRYFLLTLGILGLWLLFKRRFQFGLAFKRNWLYLLIISYMLLSVTWSRTPELSLRRWGREAITLIMICLLVAEESPVKTFLSAFKRTIYFYLPFSILLIKYFSASGREYDRWSGELMWIGLASQKNGLAYFCALSVIFLIWILWQDLLNLKSLQSKVPVLINILMLILSVYLMMGPRRTLTYSSTSFLSLLTGLIVMMSLRKGAKKGIKLGHTVATIVVMLMLIGIFMPFSGKIPLKEVPRLVGRGETLTGRTNIWNALVPYAKKHIVLGYGYGGFWTTTLREQIASHAHNGYLETVLALGFSGLILFSLFLISTAKKCTKLINNESSIYILFLSFIFMYLIRNIAETSLGEFQSISGIIIAIIYFLINEEYSTLNELTNPT
ncbi:MAG TPA: O-antigen ligase family protein [Candidatus Saccharicenans sp.]|nr:O-antigen ligase family protein [Candidatus Saccharicenans sp.]